jgi:hypothetical protein
MAKTFVNAGRRRQWVPTLMHRAGDFVYRDGFYGVVQDDSAFPSGTGAQASVADRPQMHILEGVWDLKYNAFDASLVVAGQKIWADPTYSATTLKLYHNSASLGASSAQVGRVWATAVAGASLLRVLLFDDQNY